MSLPSSGVISLFDVREELGNTGVISMDDADVRDLADVPSGTIKMSDFYGKSVIAGVWVSAPNSTNEARRFIYSAGSKDAYRQAGGATSDTEYWNRGSTFNGTAWSNSNGVNNAGGASGGTQNAAWYAGSTRAGTELRHERNNGAGWISQPDTPSRVSAGKGGGSQSTILTSGGLDSATTPVNRSLQYNGSAWSTGTCINAKIHNAQCGGQSSAMSIGGENLSGIVSATEKWNGSSWSASTNPPTVSRMQVNGGTGGSCLVGGGRSLAEATYITSYTWNNTSWTTRGNMLNTRAAAEAAEVALTDILLTKGYSGDALSSEIFT